MFHNYIKVAWRNLKRNKVFSTINIVGLSVGLSVCTLLSLYIWHETHYDNYHPNVDRLYQIGTIEEVRGKDIRFQGCPHSLAGLVKTTFPQVEASARICPLLNDERNLIQYFKADGSIRSFYEDKGFAADSGFFRLFKYNFIEGSAETAISGPYSVVLAKDIADKLFNHGPALNKVIHINSQLSGGHDYTVTGVFEPVNSPSHIDGRFFLSMYGGGIGNLLRTWTSMTSNYFFVTYILLKAGATPDQIQQQFPRFVDTYEGKDLRAAGYARKHFLINVRDIHLYANMDYGDVTPGGSVTYLYILGSIALFTLLIACINFMNLSTARSTKRSGEVGVRKTLGAKRIALVGQFLGESLMMSLLALVISLFLTNLLLPGFNKLSGKSIQLSGSQVLTLMGGTFMLSIVTGLLAGSYPALYLSSFKPVKVLKGRTRNSLAVASIRRGLVVLQFGISIVLIVAALIITNQMQYLRSADLGFSKDQQIILPLRSETSQKNYTSLKTELQKNPGVQSVGASFLYPGHVGWSGTYYPDGGRSSDNHMFLTNIIDFDFIKTLGIKTAAGHLFSNQFPADSIDGVVINETGAKQLGYTVENSVGKGFHNAHNPGLHMRIVGVMKDFHFEDLHQPIGNVAFFVNSDPIYHYILAHIRSSDINATIQSIKQAWHKLNPNEPFEYSFLDSEFQKHYEADNRLESLVNYATVIAIFISCLGLFGLAAFSAEQRTKEIGIRKIHGASSMSIVTLLSIDFMKLVLLAIIIGSPIGWYATHRWLQDFPYRTTVSWTVFAATAGAGLLIALATVSLQAFRAAKANPVKSLRTE